MSDTEYIKEQLNTLRVYLTVRVLVLIALASGTSSIFLKHNVTLDISKVPNLLFLMGILLSVIMLISIFIHEYKINMYLHKIKDNK